LTPADWTNFFTAQCGASAALIGLLFVALSINLQRILAIGYLVDRLAEAVLVFMGPLVFSIFGLVPHQGVTGFGYETLVSGLVIWSVTTFLQLRGLRDRPPQATPGAYGARVTQLQAATISTIVAGTEMSLGNPGGLYWLVPATILTYIVGITNTWVLTIEIMR
jgi:hypothetical protein